ncbi:MAG: DUF4153 domain-containing protein [Verrucomicrobia bacterium]|nr:DUF4153 domain-containing protein [Verrucomicrobiota bacterium]
MNAQHTGNTATASVETQIEAWRAHLRRNPTLASDEVAAAEQRLREQVAVLAAGGLAEAEAFLVAVRRMGATEAATREFARAQAGRLWKQLVLPGDDRDAAAESPALREPRTLWVALGLAVAAAVAAKIPALFGIDFDDNRFYLLNFGFFILPFVAVYFAWNRPISWAGRAWLAAIFVLAAVGVNAFPFPSARGGQPANTMLLTALHLPIALWLAVGIAHVGGRWWGSERRMDFVRFTGELFVYYVLIGLGGGVLIAVTVGLFEAIGLKVQALVQGWIMPCGIAGAALVATWLADAKYGVMGNLAPLLTRIFTPLFALLLLVFLATMVWTGRGVDVKREVLIAFDLLLVVVFGLLLYSASARDPQAHPGLLDWIRLTLVGTALVVDVVALWAIGTRISEFGFTPNRTAALGENIVLLVNLGGSAFLYAGFLRNRIAFVRLCNWQTFYLYVLAAWAAVVAFLFPVLFGFA